MDLHLKENGQMEFNMVKDFILEVQVSNITESGKMEK